MKKYLKIIFFFLLLKGSSCTFFSFILGKKGEKITIESARRILSSNQSGQKKIEALSRLASDIALIAIWDKKIPNQRQMECQYLFFKKLIEIAFDEKAMHNLRYQALYFCQMRLGITLLRHQKKLCKSLGNQLFKKINREKNPRLAFYMLALLLALLRRETKEKIKEREKKIDQLFAEAAKKKNCHLLLLLLDLAQISGKKGADQRVSTLLKRFEKLNFYTIEESIQVPVIEKIIFLHEKSNEEKIRKTLQRGLIKALLEKKTKHLTKGALIEQLSLIFIKLNKKNQEIFFKKIETWAKKRCTSLKVQSIYALSIIAQQGDGAFKIKALDIIDLLEITNEAMVSALERVAIDLARVHLSINKIVDHFMAFIEKNQGDIRCTYALDALVAIARQESHQKGANKGGLYILEKLEMLSKKKDCGAKIQSDLLASIQKIASQAKGLVKKKAQNISQGAHFRYLKRYHQPTFFSFVPGFNEGTFNFAFHLFQICLFFLSIHTLYRWESSKKSENKEADAPASLPLDPSSEESISEESFSS